MRHSEINTPKSTPIVEGISSKLALTTAHEFGDSTSIARGIWELKAKVGGISSKLASSTTREFGNSISFSLSFAYSRKSAPII
jgi:hypothetical protein